MILPDSLASRRRGPLRPGTRPLLFDREFDKSPQSRASGLDSQALVGVVRVDDRFAASPPLAVSRSVATAIPHVATKPSFIRCCVLLDPRLDHPGGVADDHFERLPKREEAVER